MTLYPLGIHNNLPPLDLNPGFAVAPRLAMRCIPCLSVLPTLPDATTAEALPMLGLTLLLPSLDLETTMALPKGYNGRSTMERRT